MPHSKTKKKTSKKQPRFFTISMRDYSTLIMAAGYKVPKREQEGLLAKVQDKRIKRVVQRIFEIKGKRLPARYHESDPLFQQVLGMYDENGKPVKRC
jgi:hypothetical protein